MPFRVVGIDKFPHLIAHGQEVVVNPESSQTDCKQLDCERQMRSLVHSAAFTLKEVLVR